MQAFFGGKDKMLRRMAPHSLSFSLTKFFLDRKRFHTSSSVRYNPVTDSWQ